MTMQLSRRGRASKTKTRGPPNKTQIEMKPMERIRIKLDPAEIAGRDSNELPVLTREASSQSRQKVISRTIPTNKIHKWQVRMMLPSPLVTQLLLVAALQLLAPTITSKHQILGCLAQIQQFHQTSSPTAQLHQNSDTGHHAIHHQHPISKRSEMEEFAPEVAASGGGATRPATRDDDELVAANSGLHEEVGESRTAPIKQHNGATQKLHIVRLFAPDSVQNGTQDVTIDCMFKYDKKLDQRLAIKWFFNDEVEPIYQWIPDLNKRVYSDKYERFIDKHYQVNEDVDFMLQAYKWLSAPPAPGQMERDWDHTTGPHQPTTSGGDGSSMGESGRAATAASAAELATGLDASNSILAGRRLKAYHQRHQTPRGTATQLDHLATDMDNLAAAANLATEAADQDEPDEQQVAASRKLLANRLNRLAKLGSDQSRQLLASLRSMLAMDEDEVSKFRALRLVKPTLEMDGRYTCSISSLDGDDLKSARLIVYEPPKSFTFNVSKSAGQMYNLSCQAGPTYPRPSLALYRYRAGQLEAQQQQQQAPSSAASESWPGRHAHRPRLAATALRQEPLAGTQVQVKISAKRQQQQLQPDSSYEPTILASGHKQMGPMKTIGGDMITMAGSSFPETNKLPRINLDLEEEMAQPAGSGGGVVAGSSPSIVGSYNGHHDQSMAHATNPYEISAWALIDEASLSSNLVTQFECVLTIEGANYEQRQSLALQKGWHVNSAALTAKSTLVGLMSVLASLLCLTVALVSAILIFKLLRRHANKSARVHQQVQATTRKRDSGTRRLEHTGSDRGQSNGACEQNSSSSSASTTPSDDQSATTTTSGRPTGSTIADDENRSITSRGRLTAGGLHGATTGLSSNNQDLSRNSSAQLTLPGPNSSQRNSGGGRKLLATDEANRSQPQASSRHVQPNTSAAVYQHQKLNYSRQTEQEPQQQNHSDGIYRVPETRSSFGTRYMPIGSGQQQQQHQIWSTAYSGLGPGSPIATNCSPFNNHQDYTIDDVYNNQHLLGYYQQQQSGQSLANDRGMSTTNQLAIGDGGGGGLMGNNNANKQHRPQPATISVNGKQLYC